MNTTALATVVNETREEESIDDVQILAKSYIIYKISKCFHLHTLIIDF